MDYTYVYCKPFLKLCIQLKRPRTKKNILGCPSLDINSAAIK